MDMTTQYLGFKLAHPIIPGAGPMSDDLDQVRQLEDAGAPMITLRSLFEEQLVQEQLLSYRTGNSVTESFAEAATFLPHQDEFVMGPQEYLEHLRRVKEAVSLPVVASLNGTTIGGWLDYARLIAKTGADALELNLYDLATDPARNGAAIEKEMMQVVREVKRRVQLPLAVKLSPFFTSMADVAHRLVEAGADAVVLFNRFYQPDIDIDALDVKPTLELSHSSELLLRLRWLAILSGRIQCDLAVTGGVHTASDVIKSLMCGAKVVQTVSALLHHGAKHLRTLTTQVHDWIVEHEYESLSQLRGSMNLQRCPDPRSYERANYMRVLQSWTP